MLNWLVKKFVPDCDAVDDPQVRERYSTLTGLMGIFFNLLLFGVKLPIGLITGSIAITSDAFNNVSDMGSSVISVIGMRMASRRADREHPFGHGRLEYISALAISALIFVVGFELLRESVSQLFTPEPVHLNPALLFVLALSVAVKLFMFYYNRKLGARINSSVMRATASDSLNDALTTTAVIAAALISPHVDLPVDALAGLAMSGLILYSGYSTARETVDLLLGGKPDPELVKKLSRMVLDSEGVVGIHDMILHDYGPGRVMASVHAEVSDDADIVRIHELIDAAEQRIQAQLGVPIVIHMDPISVNCERTNYIRDQIAGAARSIEPSLTIHDFRMTDGENRINLIFDLVVPCEWDGAKREAVVNEMSERMRAIDPRYRCVIQLDNQYAL